MNDDTDSQQAVPQQPVVVIPPPVAPGPTPQGQKLLELLGAILGFPIGVLTLIGAIAKQPGLAVVLAIGGAFVLSVWWAYRRQAGVEAALAWLYVIVIAVVIYVMFPPEANVCTIA